MKMLFRKLITLKGAPGGLRSRDRRFTKPLLYQTEPPRHRVLIPFQKDFKYSDDGMSLHTLKLLFVNSLLE